jgi:putative transposase
MRGWYSRGYLPHFDEPDTIQFITFRLADSMPRSYRAECEEAIRHNEIDEEGRRERIEYYVDQGHGACGLKNPAIALMMEGAIQHFDGERYRLLAWCVMPNHVYALAEMVEGFPLEDVAHSWKSFAAHRMNVMLKRKGQVWQPESFDRYMRGPLHLARTVFYIEENPVVAGLVNGARDWPYSSARFREDREDC